MHHIGSAYSLRPDVQVKRKGGLILSWTGTRVEVPTGAVGSNRVRIMSSPVPAAVRAYACPWLGPNLRLGSEVHLFWSPLRLRKSLRCFVPFSPAATLELTTAEANRTAREAYADKGGLAFDDLFLMWLGLGSTSFLPFS